MYSTVILGLRLLKKALRIANCIALRCQYRGYHPINCAFGPSRSCSTPYSVMTLHSSTVDSHKYRYQYRSYFISMPTFDSRLNLPLRLVAQQKNQYILTIRSCMHSPHCPNYATKGEKQLAKHLARTVKRHIVPIL